MYVSLEDRCRQVFQIIMDPDQPVEKVEMVKRLLQGEYFQSDQDISQLMAGVARGVKHRVNAMRDSGDTNSRELAELIQERLDKAFGSHRQPALAG